MTVDGATLVEQCQAVQRKQVDEETRRRLLDAIRGIDPETDFEAFDAVVESTSTTPGPATSAAEPEEYDELKHVCGLPLSLHNTSMLAPVDHVGADAHTLRSAMKGAVDRYRRMRVTGAKYAFNSIVHTPGILIDGKAPPIPVEEVDGNHVRVYAGCTFDQLYDALRKMTPMRSVLNQPGFEKLSVIGTMSVGGHGSGAAWGPIANFVRSVDLQVVDATGALKTLRLDHPDKPPPAMPASDTEPYPDPEGFRAVICGMGCFGAIRSIVIETQPQVLLDEKRFMTRWSEFKAGFAGYLAEMQKAPEVGGLHSMHLWMSPVPRDGGTDWDCCRLEYRYARSDKMIVPKMNAIKLSTAQTGVDLAVWAANSGLEDTLRFFMWYGLKKASMVYSTLPLERATLFGAPNHLIVSAASVGVDGGATSTITKVEKLQREFLRGELLRKTIADKELYITSPLGLRWVRKGEGLLSPQRWDVTCMIETPVNWDTNHREAMLTAYWKYAEKHLGGCPHWGQRQAMDAQQVKARYGETAYASFATQLKALDPLAYFDNDFTHRLGLRDAP